MAEESKTHENALPEEIKELERMLEEKKKMLVERGEEREHKAVFREVFREKYGEAFKPSAPSVASHIASQATPDEEEAKRAKEREEQITALIGIAFQKGIKTAVEAARKNTPWLLDELHDRMIDEYYQKLIQSGQVKELT